MRLRGLRVAVAARVALCALAAAPTASASPFDCDSDSCGILDEGAYPHLVIGTIDALATPDQAASLLGEARRRGLWSDMPGSPEAFGAGVLPVSIAVAPGRSITMLVGRDELDAVDFKPGDVVRYAPARWRHEPEVTAGPLAPYWRLIGCLAALCRAEDADCAPRHRPGLYRRADGVELNRSGEPLADGARIDPVTLLPLPAAD